MSYSYKGKILISTPDISGDIFSRSVVLVINHDENGAFGLILNKMNKNVSLRIEEKVGFKVEIFEGGPVENDKIFILAKGKPETEFFMDFMDNYYVTEDLETIIAQVLEDKISLEDLKVFSGYSGWTAQQLENEIKQKFWTVVELYNMDYTSENDQNLWKKIMQNLGGEFLIWANSPEDISMN